MITKKMQQSMKFCLIASLSAHLCMAAVCTRCLRQYAETRLGEKPVLYVSLDAQPAADAAPRAGRQRGRAKHKRTASAKPARAMPHPPRTETSPAMAGTSPVSARTDVRNQEIIQPKKNAVPAESVGKSAPARSASSNAVPGSEGGGKTEARADTGPAGPANGKGPGEVEDFTFGGGSGPAFLRRSLPVYPALARRFGREGRVVLRLTIDESGFLAEVEVLEDPGYGFASAAVAAIRKSAFSPARRNGRPVTARAILPVRFTLRGPD